LHKLIFIGSGLYDLGGISGSALESLKGCDRIYAELYTSSLKEGTIDALSEAVGKKVEVLEREDVENNDVVIKAFTGPSDLTVAFLCAGDPLTATTHQDLRIRAKRMGVQISIVPGASIVTAAPALAGLSVYKFGRITTIPFPQEGYFPQSPLEVVEENLGRGCHSLVLLDIDAKNKKYMRANQVLEYLMELERRLKHKIISGDTLACVVARAGSPEPLVRANTITNLTSMDFGPPLHCLIIPGNLHFMESEALVEVAGAPDELLKGH
jgi:diphthine synthase